MNPYNYYRANGQSFDPSSYSTRYICAYSAPGQSASDRMSNGNIFVNASGGHGGAGVMYEVDQNGTIIWGPYNADSQKAFRYECEHPGIIALQPYMNSTATTSCFSTSIENKSLEEILIFPNPSSGIINLELPTKNKLFSIKVHNNIGKEVISLDNTINISNIDMSKFVNGIYHFSIFENDKKLHSYKFSLIK